MSIFQKSVIKNHLSQIDSEQVENAFKKFNENYSISKITEIQKVKEEEYQDGFLRDIFENVLDYTLKPADNYNLAREFKNQTDGKKADGAILKNDKAVAVIELKSTKTKDLTSVTQQAFNYKNNQPDCKYVITSNFQKLRFYIDYANEYEEFDLFNMQKSEFELFYLLLHKNSILSDLPLKLKTETKFHEENISDKLYKDYSSFKYKIYRNLVKNNPQYDKLTLFKKSQKFLDRLLFVFFAEDTGLIPPNAISKIVDQWQLFIDNDEYFSLYSRFVKLFEHLDKGHKYKTYDLPAYNGGLFAPDEILDKITIDDVVLKEDALLLSAYDYSTEVDVNILGHIFEHSLNEIEEITAEIEGTATDKSKTKRKKDGVFYTPKYITQYIVENTIGKLCTEKREELGILEIEFDNSITNKNGKISAKGKKLFETLHAYKDWLFSLKIVDPACGSGAFLNQALNFLITEHQQIDDIIAELTGESLRLFDTDKTILEKNLYGVDINEESVEIAKLSLWLRTAQKGRKLSNLNHNIKCGNSLIDDPKVAGEKAFNWQKEFPHIFQKKEKKIWHITTATHNSRYSQRMFDCHITTGTAEWIDKNDEEVITQTIAEIVKESKNTNDEIHLIEYNLCGDHMHLLLACEEDELTKIVGKIKSITAKERNRARGYTESKATRATDTGRTTSTDRLSGATRGHAPLSASVANTGNEKSPSRGETQHALWTQKFGRNRVESENYLANAIEYIRTNRVKHELPENPKIEKLKKEFLCTIEYAMHTEYTGGFDVVIGNPPYVQLQSMGEMSNALEKCGYETYNKSSDLYCLFYEKGCQLLKNKGLLGYITPNKWMQVKYGAPLRKLLIRKFNPIILVDFPGIQVFADAVLDPNILIVTNEPNKNETRACIIKNKTEDIKSVFDASNTTIKLSDENWKIIPKKDKDTLEQMQNKGVALKKLPVSIYRGILTGYNDAFFIDESTKEQLISANQNSAEIIKPMVRGRDIAAYEITGFEYLISTFPSLNLNIEKYPAIKEHLHSFGYDRLKQTGDKGSRKKAKGKWFETQDCIAYHNDFSKPKIIYPNMTSVFPFMYDESGVYGNDKSFILTANNNSVSLQFLTALFNSSLAKLWIWYNCPELGDNRREIRKIYFEHFPVAKANPEQTENMGKLAMDRTSKTSEFQKTSTRFIKRIKDNLELEKLSTKLEKFYDYDFKTFVAELKKKKIKLSLVQQDEWEEYFNAYKTEINALQNQISTTDKEIDQLVYKLYELTEDEIKSVENSVK